MHLPENVIIRPATLHDLDAIVALWMAMMHEHEAFDRRVRLADHADEAYRQYARHHLSSGGAAFVAEHPGAVIGFCLAYSARNLPMFSPQSYGYLSDLTVSRPWRGRGIGSGLVEAVKQRLREHGIAHIQLQVYDGNTRGQTFWRKMGFGDFIHGLWCGLSEKNAER